MNDDTWPDTEEAVELRERAIELRRWCDTTSVEDRFVRDDLAELATAARFSELFADKAILMQGRRTGNVGDAVDGSTLAERMRAATKQYAECWNRRNKPSGLNDINAALESVARECAGKAH